MTDLGSRFVAALAAKDTNRLVGLFASEVDFRGMTPRRFWEVDTPQRVVHEVLYEWFEPKDPLSALTMSRPGRSLIGNVSTTASWFVTPTGPSW
jgi:hypothetical protein